MKKKYILSIIILSLFIISFLIIKYTFIDTYYYKKEKEKIIMLANTYFDKESYDVAKKFIENLLVKHPDDEDLLKVLNKIIDKEKEIEKLRSEELANLERQRYNSLLNDLLHRIKMSNDPNRKSTVLTKEKNKYIDTAELEQLLNEILDAYQKKDFATAKTKLNQALNIDNENPYFNALLAVVLFEENPNDDKNIEEASKRAKFALEKDNLIEIAHFALAEIYFVKGLYSESVNEYTETLKLNPNKYEAAYAIGKIYFQNKDYEKAEIYFTNTIKIKSDFVVAYYYLALSENYLNKYNSAKEYLNKAIKLDPNFYYAYAKLGEIYQQEGNYDEAINSYKAAYNLNNNYEYIINIADSYNSNNHFNEATLNYDRALSENKLKSEKDRLQALDCYKKIIDIKINSKDDTSALLYIKKCTDALGEDARKMYEISGDIKTKSGKYKEALLDYQYAASNENDNDTKSGIYYKIGICYYSLNNYSKAKGILNELKSLNPGYKDMAKVDILIDKMNKGKN